LGAVAARGAGVGAAKGAAAALAADATLTAITGGPTIRCTTGTTGSRRATETALTACRGR
jgi:hypothetical protein